MIIITATSRHCNILNLPLIKGLLGFVIHVNLFVTASKVPSATFFTSDGQNAVHFRNARGTFPKCTTDNKKRVMMSFRYVLSNRNASFITNGNRVPILYLRGDPAQHTLRYKVTSSESTKDTYSLPDCYNCETY
jgi:hypothetical protein